MKFTDWVTCAKCNKPAVPGDMIDGAHEYCDEPTWQKCAGCGDAVHLSHVEYTGKENTPWCESCNTPLERWERACRAIWNRQQRRHPEHFTGPRDMRQCHDPLYLAASHHHTFELERKYRG